jgi:hypothetical protein
MEAQVARRYTDKANSIEVKMDKLFDYFVGFDENSEQYQAVKRAKDNGIIK